MVGNEFIDFLVESKNSLGEPLPCLLSVLNICLYILLIGLYPVYEGMYLLVAPGHELGLGVNRIAIVLDISFYGKQPLLDCVSVGLK